MSLVFYVGTRYTPGWASSPGGPSLLLVHAAQPSIRVSHPATEVRNKTNVESVQLGKTLDLNFSFPPMESVKCGRSG